MLARYTVVYPEWRKNTPDVGIVPAKAKNVSFCHGLIKPRSYDIVFLCRSSCWTPSWADNHWMAFIEHWKRYEWLWNSKAFSKFVLRERKPNLTEALKLAKEDEKRFRELRQAKKEVVA